MRRTSLTPIPNGTSQSEAIRSRSKRKMSDISNNPHENVFSSTFPAELEEEFATALFEYGLKQSSPKILISLMPQFPGLNTEHIKSHLQKYRIHNDRSKAEFMEYYRENIRGAFANWLSTRAWEDEPSQIPRSLSSSSWHAASSSSSSAVIPVLPNPAKVAGYSDPYTSDHMKRSRGGSINQVEVLQQAEHLLNDWNALYNETYNEYEHFVKYLEHNEQRLLTLPSSQSHHADQHLISTVSRSSMDVIPRYSGARDSIDTGSHSQIAASSPSASSSVLAAMVTDSQAYESVNYLQLHQSAPYVERQQDHDDDEDGQDQNQDDESGERSSSETNLPLANLAASSHLASI
jgi:SHAQKYF class myb-like DNA-binding protein